MTATSVVKDDILHVVYYGNPSFLPTLNDIANTHEGYIHMRQGFNFPSQLVKRPLQAAKLFKDCTYVIIYPSNDVTTKLHELRHARFYLDPTYRTEVQKLWDSLSHKKQRWITTMLTKMGYDAKFHLDEFQAYFFTEKRNFFSL